jgi:hypothetical protein
LALLLSYDVVLFLVFEAQHHLVFVAIQEIS